MSTAVLIEANDGVAGAWDSLATLGANESVEIVEDKVFMNGKLLFAVAGTLRGLVAIKHAKFTGIKKTEDKQAYIVQVLLPELRAVLSEAGEEPSEDGIIEMDVIVGIRGELFDLSGLQTPMQRMDRVYTIGSGSAYARGALAHGANVRDAVKVAVQYDAYSGGEVRSRAFTW